MQIECKLKRAGGTTVPMGEKTYHFNPLDDGAHVAEVTIEEHIARFLSIPEGYRFYNANGHTLDLPEPVVAASAPVDRPEQEVEPVLTSVLHPEHVTIGGQVYTVNQFARMGYDKSGLSAEDWNSLTADTRADFIDEALTELNAAVPDVEDEQPADEEKPHVDAEDSRATLVAKYEAKFNKKPHHKLSDEKIRAAIDEA